MANLNQIHSKFADLEMSALSERALLFLIEGLNQFNIVEGMFTDFINKRMRDKIPLSSFERIQNNLDRYELSPYRMAFNNAIFSSYVYRDCNAEYFFFCINNDREGHFLENTIITLAKSVFLKKYLEITRTISNKCNINFYSLLSKILSQNAPFSTLQSSIIADFLSLEEKSYLCIYALDNFQTCDALEINYSDDSISDTISALIKKDRDNSLFATKLRSGTIGTHSLVRFTHLLKFIIYNGNYIPLTTSFLLEDAIKSKCYDFLIEIAALFNKKMILKQLVKSNNKDIINKFFNRYHSDPDVKHLTPFI